jgi:hypothetical protein
MLGIDIFLDLEGILAPLLLLFIQHIEDTLMFG